MAELRGGKDVLEKQKASVKERIDEIQATIKEKRKELKIVDRNIQNINDKIEEKQVTIPHESNFFLIDVGSTHQFDSFVSLSAGNLR